MASITPSIDKLLKKLEKEPNSLIFLQLAEEYRKEGMHDDALEVCREGLQRHPNYWSARVALGRIYLEMSQTDSARDELEKVIKAVPDNLLANKLLGDIYQEAGRYSDALKRYELVQMLTPNDQEVASNIQKIESQISAASSASRPEPVAARTAPATLSHEPPPPETVATPAKSDVDRTAPSMQAIEIPDLFEKTDPKVKPTDAVNRLAMDLMDSTMPQRMTASSPDQTDPLAAALFLEAGRAAEPEGPTQVKELATEIVTSFGSAQSVTLEDVVVAAPGRRPEDRTQPIQQNDDAADVESADELTTQTLAELYVQQGLNDKAVKVYHKLLLNDPGNQQIFQRLKDLNPADVLLAGAGREDLPRTGSRGRGRDATVSAAEMTNRVDDQVSEERKRKITTLESWLTSIRRERS